MVDKGNFVFELFYVYSVSEGSSDLHVAASVKGWLEVPVVQKTLTSSFHTFIIQQGDLVLSLSNNCFL